MLFIFLNSFSNLDNLSKLVDEFICDISKIEMKLAAQSLIESGNIDSSNITKEYESLKVSSFEFKKRNNLFFISFFFGIRIHSCFFVFYFFQGNQKFI